MNTGWRGKSLGGAALNSRPSTFMGPGLSLRENRDDTRYVGQATSGGIELSMVSMLAPALKPNIVPRS